LTALIAALRLRPPQQAAAVAAPREPTDMTAVVERRVLREIVIMRGRAGASRFTTSRTTYICCSSTGWSAAWANPVTRTSRLTSELLPPAVSGSAAPATLPLLLQRRGLARF
jgi:hypothetical protein